MIFLKRVYDGKGPDDGYRVLVDRWWPRGVRKEAAALDYWAKELAPSDALIEFYHHDAKRWGAFLSRFREELKAPAAQAALKDLARIAKVRNITLLYASRETVKNNAAVVKRVVEEML